MENRCIVCGKKRDGLPVVDDAVIKTVRAVKWKVFKKRSNNRLTVCKQDYPKYSKMREQFEKRRTAYLALGIVFAIVLFVSSPSIGALLVGLFIIALMYLLSLLSYAPMVKMPKKRQ